MITKYIIHNPVETFAFEKDFDEVKELKYFTYKEENNLGIFTYDLSLNDRIYGLGETMGKFNKRGKKFTSFNLDNPHHKEDGPSLYGSHNFIIVDGKETFGIFFDNPGKMTFEFDVNHSGKIIVTAENVNTKVYIIENETPYLITKEFLDAVGQSNIPPLWAFGFIQSRWGYKCEKDFDDVINNYKKADIPVEGLCLDIDYMDRYIDFSVNKERFPDLKAYSDRMKKEGRHLIPIIDAGIKVEPGNNVYEEGIKNNYFCTNKEGKPFQAAVWPGMTHFTDFFKEDARKWFGRNYKVLTDMGIEGFWNDMNEPAIFYSEYSKRSKLDMIKTFISPGFAEKNLIKNSDEEYKYFYHDIEGKKYLHYDVHNVFGSLMTKAAGDELKDMLSHRYLLFSRSSYIGASRSGGIWTGDNESTWTMLKHNVYMMPALNMCGFIYSGADTGGFGKNCNKELALRWHAFSVFTPLFRNHSNLISRHQECYQFHDDKAFKGIIELRYRLMPYLYSEFVKAALNKDMFIKPLSFVFENDEKAKDIEDQLMVGESIMIAPITDKGVTSRKVYLPSDMTKVLYNGKDFINEEVKKGEITVECRLNEVVFFILKDKLLPIANKVSLTDFMDLNDVTLLGNGKTYEQYIDDGYTKNVAKENIKTLTK